jgi:hypothetical protein
LAEPANPYAFPAAQPVHVSVPTVILYEPAAHVVHVPVVPVYPAPQLTAAAAPRMHAAHTITHKTRTSRMPHTPRAFIHTEAKMGFGLFVFFY